ncbi:MAG: hypothetical protein IPP77_05905 [Bacteroidetes bacterium]|nr:hypothetical protein [Bacteroidota bacterium]
MALGDSNIAKIAANPGTFVTPNVTLADMTPKNNQLRTAITAAANGDWQKIADMHNVERDWDGM